MKIAKTLAITAAAMLIGSWAFAQEVTQTGKIVKVDKTAGKVTIEHGAAPGTVGAAANQTFVYNYDVPDAATLSSLRPNDRVEFTAKQGSGKDWTAIKITKQ